ncbi:predicted protein [Mycolicibacterium brisbanense]|uniref:Uncharacterized protein n=1 Tax=Mycolicibacterium brisbanense TaxID=146020 RepID=A0A117I6L5_9MYCO|nr:predicted protein [Mycolicibacterium brisbanense]
MARLAGLTELRLTVLPGLAELRLTVLAGLAELRLTHLSGLTRLPELARLRVGLVLIGRRVLRLRVTRVRLLIGRVIRLLRLLLLRLFRL